MNHFSVGLKISVCQYGHGATKFISSTVATLYFSAIFSVQNTGEIHSSRTATTFSWMLVGLHTISYNLQKKKGHRKKLFSAETFVHRETFGISAQPAKSLAYINFRGWSNTWNFAYINFRGCEIFWKVVSPFLV